MAKEISINFSVFQKNVKKLRNSSLEIVSKKKVNQSFKKTNISPFTDDLEQAIKVVELLDRYRQLLEEDINTLEKIGEDMRENDEKLSQQYTK